MNKKILFVVSMKNILIILFGIWSFLGDVSIASGAQNSPPFFPIGLYSVDDTSDFPEIASTGFNLIQSYKFEGIPPWGKTDQQAKDYFDAAQKTGLRVLAGMAQEAVQDQNVHDKQDLAFIQQRVRVLKNHPALWGYMLFDEPESLGYKREAPVRPANFNKVYHTIKKLDTVHPVHPVLTTPNANIDNTYPYLGVDIILLQYSMLPPGSYPAPWDTLENLGEAHRSSFETLASKGTPFLFSVPCYNLANDPEMWPGILEYNPKAVGRYPTREEMRFIAYSGIIRGAKGIVFICYKSLDGDGKIIEDISRKANPKQWQAVSSVSKELQTMTPILLAPQSSVRITVTPTNADTQFLLKEYQEKLYLLALNSKEQKKTVKFTFSKPITDVKAYNETRTIVTQGNSFTDNFDGYGVHVYEIRR